MMGQHVVSGAQLVRSCMLLNFLLSFSLLLCALPLRCFHSGAATLSQLRTHFHDWSARGEWCTARLQLYVVHAFLLLFMSLCVLSLIYSIALTHGGVSSLLVAAYS